MLKITPANRTGQKVLLTTHKRKNIEENLRNLQSHKKKIAQERYYSANAHLSPLLKNEEVKPPVHLRLGVDDQKKYGAGKSNISRSRFRWQPQQQQQGLVTRKYRNRMNNQRFPKTVAQRRMERLRQNLRQSLHPKKVLLTRKRTTPVNLSVKFQNTDYVDRSVTHSIRASLNPELQHQIAIILQQVESHEDIPVNATFTLASTKMTINDRFSTYP